MENNLEDNFMTYIYDLGDGQRLLVGMTSMTAGRVEQRQFW